MNNCNGSRYVVPGNCGRGNGDLSNSSNYCQQNLPAFQSGSLILCSNIRCDSHHIRNINSRIPEVVDTDDWYTAIGWRARLDDAVSY